MTMLSIPTDNFYKFCAITGLILIGSMVVPVGKLMDLHLEFVEIKAVVRIIERLAANRTVEASTDDGSIQTESEGLTVIWTDADIRRVSEEARRGMARQMATAWHIGVLSVVCCALAIAGLRLARFGFSGWSEQHQKALIAGSAAQITAPEDSHVEEAVAPPQREDAGH